MNRPPKAATSALAISAGLIVLAMLAGCSIAQHTVDVNNLGPANQVMVYGEGGNPVFERTIAEGSDEDEAIASWLRAHPDGWRLDVVSYVPARQV